MSTTHEKVTLSLRVDAVKSRGKPKHANSQARGKQQAREEPGPPGARGTV